MPSTAELKERRAKALATREDLEKNLAEKIGLKDKIEEERHEFRRELEKLEERDPELEATELKIARRIERIEHELADLARQWQAADERVDKLRPRVEKITRRIKRLGRRIRNSIAPKIVDLHMAGASSPMGQIHGSIGHYTAGALATSDEAAVRMWWLVRAQHMGQGWSNIGYHIGLGPEGGIYLLRPLAYAGAHTLGRNTGYVGFSVHGTTGHKPTRAQARALRVALNKWNLDDKPVWGHNDFNPTGCPGSFKPMYVSKGRNL